MLIIAGVALLSISYTCLPSKRKEVLKSIAGSCIRFTRSLRIGMTISMDYLIAPLMGYTETEIHRRSADRIVQGCLQNGGIYVKLGQGLTAINHILPKEYVESLSILQVSLLQIFHNFLVVSNLMLNSNYHYNLLEYNVL